MKKRIRKYQKYDWELGTEVYYEIHEDLTQDGDLTSPHDGSCTSSERKGKGGVESPPSPPPEFKVGDVVQFIGPHTRDIEVHTVTPFTNRIGIVRQVGSPSARNHFNHFVDFGDKQLWFCAPELKPAR